MGEGVVMGHPLLISHVAALVALGGCFTPHMQTVTNIFPLKTTKYSSYDSKRSDDSMEMET